MLPRRQSIFHLGEEGGAAVHHHRVGVVGAAMTGANGRHAHAAASIVLKQMVRPRAAAASRHAGVPCSFLKACSLCRRDLSPSKDVYMYRYTYKLISNEPVRSDACDVS